MRTFLLAMILMLWSTLGLGAVPLGTKIKGLRGETLENAEKRVEKILKMHQEAKDDQAIERLSNRIKQDIIDAVKPYGYYTATVRATLKKTKQQWQATYIVSPGRRVAVRQVNIRLVGEGQSDKQFKAAIREFPLKKGEPLKTPLYKKAKDNLLDLAASRGYFDAKMVQSQVSVDLKSHTALINITLITGKRYRFGAVTFIQKNDGAKRLSNRFLQRFLKFKEGDSYSQKALFQLQEQLVASHYFQQVTITPKPHRARGYRVPIAAKVIASKAKRYQFGLGVGTDSGLRGLMGVKFRRFTSDGHYAEINAKGSYKNNIDGKLNASYNIPGHNPNTDLYKIIAEVEREDEDNFGISTIGKLGFSYTTEIIGWQQTVGLTYQAERSIPVDETPFSSDLVMPTVAWLRVKSDDPIKPNSGYKIAINGRAASTSLLSSTNFAQGWVNAKWLETFGDDFRVIARGNLGMVGINDIENLPLSLRFAAGGSQTIRGYGFKDVKDGRTLSIASLELQQRIYGDFYAAAFFDIGDIGPAFFDQVKRGVGVGLVWRSPVGAISLTLAQAIDKPGQPRRIEFSMGPEL